jgi:hypothetical protein
VRALGSRSGEVIGERMTTHSGQGLPGECYRLKVHMLGKIWSSNSRRANMKAERGDTHRRGEGGRWFSEFQHDQWVIREASRYWNGEG